ncbi:MAG: glycosyltransferase [Gemmatimonadales bacterium]|nr:glycosyltransferase [Gemmatimonadales bacterium]
MTRVAPLSVAISTRDRPDALGRCLSALAAGDAVPAQVIVVDQSRDDETRSMLGQARWGTMSVTCIRQEPLGLAASQNTAVASASCPTVAVIDDDCIADRQWLATIESTFASQEELGALTGRVLPLESEGDRVYPVASRTSIVRKDFSGKTVPWPVGGGNNFAVRREWFDRIGGCDERLGPGTPGQGGLDMDLFYRLLREGARIRYEPAALVYHERQTKAGRLARRPMYGHGMGASCVLRLREGDLYALRLLGEWVFFRGRLLGSALLRRQWLAAYEEWLMLGGTLRGVVHGVRDRRPQRGHGPGGS